MKKSQENLLHGCKVPRFILGCVLIIEYVVILNFFMNLYENKQGMGFLVVGYIILTFAITYNNHGKNVRVRYEQELSIVFKSILTNVIMMFFGIAGISIDDISEFIMQVILLTLVQVGSIICILGISTVAAKRNEGIHRLYICDKNDIDVSSVTDAQKVFITDVSLSDIRKYIMKNDEIYLHDIASENRNDCLKICFECNKPVYFTSKISDMELRTAAVTQDGESPLFYKDSHKISGVSAAVKRCCDIVLSGICLVILSPIFIIIALAIKLEDGDAVFYRQVRCTKDMKEFHIIKFRSMVAGAEEQLGPRLADKKDSRLTKVGYVLRKCKLDELPQLINIFVGDMSFVGPRPERPELIQETIKNVPEFVFRTTVKAGLTGYAQVHGDYHTDFLDKLKWDIMYIENYSLLLDLKILIMTIPAVLRGSDDV